MSASSWILVKTAPRQERRAAIHSEQQGFKALLPLYQEQLSPDHVKIHPLYPGYLFVRVKGDFHSLNNTIGISYIVTFAGRPARVPLRVIKTLRSMMEEDGFISMEHKPRFRHGQPLRITEEGHMENQIGLYDGITAEGRIKLLLQMLGRQTIKTVAPDDIEEIKEDA